jgi:LPXTG-motif cell wall-anchored protein
MPPDVGVKIPTQPKLQKQRLDYAGQPLKVAEDTAFRFLVYEGEAISDKWDTQDELTALLERSGRKYHIFSFTVPTLAAQSDAQFLAWQWEHGKSYTVTELQDHSDFRFSSFNTAKRNSYSFTYYADRNLSILCTNYKPNWDLKLQKVDSQTPTQGLSGALFALYSPLERDQLGEDAWNALPVKPQLTVTAEGQTWYLHSVTVTSSQGSILWKDLQEERYYLLEVLPPAGYLKNPVPGQIVQRSESADGLLSVTVQNTAGYEIPNTGGAGTHIFTAAGLALIIPCLLLLRKKRRKA